MKKIVLVLIALISLNSCISLKFPDSVNVEITVPVDTDVEKIEVMIDTLKAQAKRLRTNFGGLNSQKRFKG